MAPVLPSTMLLRHLWGLPSGSNFGLPRWLRRQSVCPQWGSPKFNPRVGKIPWEGNGNPLHYSCQENPMDKGAWQTTVRGRGGCRKRVRPYWACKRLRKDKNLYDCHLCCHLVNGPWSLSRIPFSSMSQVETFDGSEGENGLIQQVDIGCCAQSWDLCCWSERFPFSAMLRGRK